MTRYTIAVVVEDRSLGEDLVLVLVVPFDFAAGVEKRLEKGHSVIVVEVGSLPGDRCREELSELRRIQLTIRSGRCDQDAVRP